MSGHRRDGDRLCQLLAERGVCCASVNYRLARAAADGPAERRHPAPTLDVARAFAWLAALRAAGDDADARWDPARVYLAGHSVGAHALGLLVLAPERYDSGRLLRGLRGVVALEGLFDTRRFHGDEPNWRHLVDFACPADRALWDSPVDYRRADWAEGPARAPWLLVHSLEDPWLQRNQSDAMHAHLLAQGVLSELCVLERGGNHDQVLRLIGAGGADEAAAAVRDRAEPLLLAFLRRHGACP